MGAPFECALGVVGPRGLVTSLPFASMDRNISIDTDSRQRMYVRLTLTVISMLAVVASVLWTASASVWVCHFEIGQ